jgi:cell division septation protein DedD
VFGLRVHRVRATGRRVSTPTVRVSFGPPLVQTVRPRKRALPICVTSCSAPASCRVRMPLMASPVRAPEGRSRSRARWSRARRLSSADCDVGTVPVPAQPLDPGRNQRPTADLTSRLGTCMAVVDCPKARSSPDARRGQLSRASHDRPQTASSSSPTAKRCRSAAALQIATHRLHTKTKTKDVRLLCVEMP